MVKIIRVVVIISGILVIALPITISILWTQYLDQYKGGKKSAGTLDNCTPFDFSVKAKEGEKITMTWKTTEACTGYVLIAPDQKSFSAGEKVIPFQGSSVSTNFETQIPLADANKNPYAVIVSNGAMYGIDEEAIKITK